MKSTAKQLVREISEGEPDEYYPRFIAIVILALGFLLTSFSSDAQQVEKVPRIGILETGSPTTPNFEAFRQGLRDLGYVEGQNIMLEHRYAEGRFERLPNFAAELVHLKVDVLVTGGSQPVQVLKHATSTIPIVGVALADPVGTGFAASFARPGGNVTGLAFQNADLSTKRLELLKEAAPEVTRIAVLWDIHNPASESAVRATEEAARSLGLQLHLLEVQGPYDFDSTFDAAHKGRAQALLQVGSPLFNTHRKTLLDLVAKSRLPATCESRAFVVEGCLMAYGPSFADMWRRAATYVDKILKGTKPGDLPMEQPMKFELVINLKTAQALGLTLPPSILFQADEVLQ
jgi:putative ABC transport system substrate-binding protein